MSWLEQGVHFTWNVFYSRFQNKNNRLVKPAIRSEPADQTQNTMWAPTWTLWWDLRTEKHVLRSFELSTPHRACSLRSCGIPKCHSSTVWNGWALSLLGFRCFIQMFLPLLPWGKLTLQSFSDQNERNPQDEALCRPSCTSPSCKAQLKPLQFCSLVLLVPLQQLISSSLFPVRTWSNYKFLPGMRPTRNIFFRRTLYGLHQAPAKLTGSCGSSWSSPWAQGFPSPGCSWSAVSEGTQFLLPTAHPFSFPLNSLWWITETVPLCAWGTQTTLLQVLCSTQRLQVTIPLVLTIWITH